MYDTLITHNAFQWAGQPPKITLQVGNIDPI